MSTTVTVEALWDQESMHGLHDHVDSWLTDLVLDTVDFAGHRLREHAPGRIGDFVRVDYPHVGNLGAIEGEAVVTSDPTEQFVSKRGSRRADFPLYVDIGTGIYGEHHRPITSFPPNHMGPVEIGGQMVYLSEIRGQPAQDYSGAATRETNAWLPGHIKVSATKLGNL